MSLTPFFICFSGIDGAGKTTVAKELAGCLKKEGRTVKYVYSRFNPIILKPFLFLTKFFFLKKINVMQDYSGYSNKKSNVITKYPLSASIYKTILLFDYFLQITYKIKLPLLLNQNVICDRYIFDTIATDLAIDFHYTDNDIRTAINSYEKFIPKPDRVFYIDIPEEIAFKRKNDIPSIQYLTDRKKIFNKINEHIKVIKIDGTLSTNMQIEQIMLNLQDIL
jgi:dTMP kinase